MNIEVGNVDSVELAGLVCFLFAHGLEVEKYKRIGNSVKMHVVSI